MKWFPNKAADSEGIHRSRECFLAIGAGQNDFDARLCFRGFGNNLVTRSSEDWLRRADHVNVALVRANEIDGGGPVGGFENRKPVLRSVFVTALRKSSSSSTTRTLE